MESGYRPPRVSFSEFRLPDNEYSNSLFSLQLYYLGIRGQTTKNVGCELGLTERLTQILHFPPNQVIFIGRFYNE